MMTLILFDTKNLNQVIRDCFEQSIIDFVALTKKYADFLRENPIRQLSRLTIVRE